MKSDIVKVTNNGEGMAEAMEQAAASALFRGLNHKEAIRLRLLSEEMLGMVRQITGKTEADFWVESAGKRFELHLTAHPVITGEMRKELLSVASSGKNAAAVGVMGKLRDIFERAFDAADLRSPANASSYYMQGLMVSASPDGADPMSFALNSAIRADAACWSLRQYRATVEQEKLENGEAQEEWDELEKSIVANLADEVSIAIRNGAVEMVIYKDFSEENG